MANNYFWRLIFITLLFTISNYSAAQTQENTSVKVSKRLIRQVDLRGKNALSIGIGTSIMNGDFNNPISELYYHVGYKRFLGSSFAINFGFHKFNLAFKDVYNEGFMSYDIDLEWYLSPSKKLSPFVYGGAGYHYDGRVYSGRFFHARPVSTCNSCHDPHSLEVAFEPCLTCHQGDSPKDIRISRQSYDGSGNTAVGIRADIQANAARLLNFIESYAADVVGAPIVYDGAHYPYFFADANGDGFVDQSDGQSVVYANWTPRSLRAAYNWKLVSSDPGNFAHNPHYVLELLYDSIEDLSAPLGIDMDALDLLR